MSKQVRAWGLNRLLSKLWLLACLSVCLSVCLLLLGRCGLQENTSPTTCPPVESYASLLEQREEETRAEVARLTSEIRSLKLKLLQLTANQDHASWLGQNDWNTTECASHVKRQIEAAELTHGVPLNNEYEMIPFAHFTLNRIYPTDLGLGKRVVEKPIGFRKKDMYQVLDTVLEMLNRNATRLKAYTLDDFVEGLYRTQPITGTEYDLYFKNKNSRGGTTKVTVLRPFAPLVSVSTSAAVTSKRKPLVHIIVPLSGSRIGRFQSFMEKLVKIGMRVDRRVLLTVVFFGEDGLSQARLVMSKSVSPSASPYVRLLALNETFSRTKGLRVGAMRDWETADVMDEDDVLLFFCDVDIVFSARFLERCRWNAKAGNSVYYPVIFSLYNPQVVYTLQGRPVPSETDRLLISRDTGFWKDFSYGMTCQYKSDLEKIGGLSEGWMGDDVTLYRKYVRSGLKVIRATDPGIFHVWHSKPCDHSHGVEAFRTCVRARALVEASHAQLGLLAFSSNSTVARPPSPSCPCQVPRQPCPKTSKSGQRS